MPKPRQMQKPKPSKEVLDMIKHTKAKSKSKKSTAKREDLSQAAARIVRQATENH